MLFFVLPGQTNPEELVQKSSPKRFPFKCQTLRAVKNGVAPTQTSKAQVMSVRNGYFKSTLFAMFEGNERSSFLPGTGGFGCRGGAFT